MLYGLLQNDVHILKEGDKVGASDATLLNMLNISPFSYGLLVQMVYDSGTIFEPAILDIKPEDLRVKFSEVLYWVFNFSKILLLLLLLLLNCKWVVTRVAALRQYGTTNNIHKQIQQQMIP
jgi:hypothetical protein